MIDYLVLIRESLLETRYPSYFTLKFPIHHLFYTCHCVAPKAPPDPKNPSLVSFLPSLIQGSFESDTRVHVREHEQAEHMSFGMDCVWPEPVRIYTFSVSVCLWLKTYIYVIGRQRVKSVVNQRFLGSINSQQKSQNTLKQTKIVSKK